MRLEQFEFILEVASKKSMQKAADNLHTSIQNVSKLIKQLEDELHVQLFVRNKYGVFLTPDGEYICAEAQKIIDAVGNLQKRYIFDNNRPAINDLPHMNILTAHATSEFCSTLLEKICGKYDPQSASIFIEDALTVNQTIEKDPSSLFPEYDFIFTNLVQSELNRIKKSFKENSIYFLQRDRLGVRLSVDNLLSDRKSISIKDIIDQPLILAVPDPGSFSHLQIVIESLGVVIKPKYTVNAPTSCNFYIQKNLGYSIITYDDSSNKIFDSYTDGTRIIPLKEQIFVNHIMLISPYIVDHALVKYTLSFVKKNYPEMHRLF